MKGRSDKGSEASTCLSSQARERLKMPVGSIDRKAIDYHSRTIFMEVIGM